MLQHGLFTKAKKQMKKLCAWMGPVTIARNTDPEGLKKECAPHTLLDGLLQGRPDYAATWFNWGFGSPYFVQDAFFLLCGVVLSSLCLPVLLLRLISSPFKGSLREALDDLWDALRMILIGGIRGAMMLAISPFRDSAKWIEMKKRDAAFPQDVKSAILATDMQNDFFPGGTLAVKGAEETVPVVQMLVTQKRKGVRYFATQDWHPENHGSFAVNLGVVTFSETTLNGVPQVAWPVHCVQGTYGAQLVEGIPAPDVMIQKAQDPRNDSYSAVADQGIVKKETKLMSHLHAEGIKRVFVCGVATDYCVRATAEDLAKRGLEVIVIEDACRGIYAGLTGEARNQAYQATQAELETYGVVFMPAKTAMHIYSQQF